MGEKRAHGTGYVEKRESKTKGTRYRPRFPDRGRALNAGTFSSEADALDALDGIVEAVRSITASTAATFRQAGEAFLDRLDQIPNRRGSERSYWAHLCDAPFIDVPLDEIAADSQPLVDWFELKLPRRKKTRIKMKGGRVVDRIKLDEEISHQTCIHVKNLASRIFVKNKKLVPHNPMRDVELPAPTSHASEEWTFLFKDELDLLESAVERGCITERQQLRLLFAIFVGMREGELIGLRRSKDIYLSATQPYIRVRRSYEKLTKTRKPHTVYLLPRAVAILRRLLELEPKNKHDLLFTNEQGEMYGQFYDFGWADTKTSAVKSGVTRGLRSRIGITREVTFHALRHTCASHLLMGTFGKRWTLPDVQRHLGHMSAKTTERYAELEDSMRGRLAAETFHAEPEPARDEPAPAAPPTSPKILPSGGVGGSNLSLASAENLNECAALSEGSGLWDSNPRLAAWEAEADETITPTCGGLGGIWEPDDEALMRAAMQSIARGEVVADRTVIALLGLLTRRASSDVALAARMLAETPEHRSDRVLDVLEALTRHRLAAVPKPERRAG